MTAPVAGEEGKVVVIPGNEGEEAQDFARILRAMYAAWDGPLHLETGVHALRRNSPFDGQHRRHSSFAGVVVGDTEVDKELPPVRYYTLDPYKLAQDYTVLRETDHVDAVLAGDLSCFYSDDGDWRPFKPETPWQVAPISEVSPERLAAAINRGRELAAERGWKDLA